MTSASASRDGRRTDHATALTARLFDRADAADDAVRRVLADPDLAEVLPDDAATIRWDDGAPLPSCERCADLSSPDDPLGDGFWELVLGLTLRVPLLGAAVGGVAGARGGSLADVGIDETFMNRLRDALVPGRSALLVVGPRSFWDLVDSGPTGPEWPGLMVTELSDRQLGALREVFAP